MGFRHMAVSFLIDLYIPVWSEITLTQHLCIYCTYTTKTWIIPSSCILLELLTNIQIVYIERIQSKSLQLPLHNKSAHSHKEIVVERGRGKRTHEAN
jgi:hypothetical protein